MPRRSRICARRRLGRQALALLLLTTATAAARELPAELTTDAYMTWLNVHVTADLGQTSLGLAPLQTVIAAFEASTDHLCTVNPVRPQDYRTQWLVCTKPDGHPAISAKLRYADDLYVLANLSIGGRPLQGPAAAGFLRKVVPIKTILDKFRILAIAPKVGPIDLGTLPEIRKSLAVTAEGSSCTTKTRDEDMVYEVACSIKSNNYSFTLKNNGFNNLVLTDLRRDAKPLNAVQQADAFRDLFDVDPNHP